jgi:hypothetical protein
MNPRIKRLRVIHGGKTLVEKTLDPEQRGLQDIAIDGGGGDYKLEVIEIVPGTKKTWREISISELEVWGSPGKVAATKKPLKPAVRVGSFDPPPTLTRAECVKAMFPDAKGDRIASEPDADKITSFAAVALGGDIDICRIDHGTEANSSTVELAAVKRTPRLAVVDRVPGISISKEITDPQMGGGRESNVDIAPFPLTTAETAIIVETTEHSFGPMSDGGDTTSTLYRVTPTTIAEVLHWKSTWSSGESSDADRCTLQPPALGTSLPELELSCQKEEGRWHDEDPRGNGLFTEERTERFRWTGRKYEKR